MEPCLRMTLAKSAWLARFREVGTLLTLAGYHLIRAGRVTLNGATRRDPRDR